MTVPLLGGEQRSRAVQVNNQQSINLYPVLTAPGAKAEVALFSVPGMSLVGTAGVDACRSNGIEWKGWLYFVLGNVLYRTDGGSILSSVGTLNGGTRRVVFAKGRDYIMLVDGVSGYTVDATNTFAEITDTDFPTAPTHVAYLNGYFIVNNPGTDEFHISDNEDPTSWPGDFANAESNPDNLLAVAANERDLYLIGPETVQPYYVTDNVDFPFSPYQSGIVELGVLAPYSVVQTVQGICMLARAKDGDMAVMLLSSGGGLQAIDNDDIRWQISELSNPQNCFAFVYRHRGRAFYVMQFPTATFVCDLSNNLWHTRESFGKDYWRAAGYGYINRRHVVGDRDSGAMYTLDYDTYDENGDHIIRTRKCQVVHRDNRVLAHHELTLEVTTGVGISKTVAFKLAFTLGGVQTLNVNDVIQGQTSGATATVAKIELTGGTGWGLENAAGTLTLTNITGTFESEDVDVISPTPVTNILTASGAQTTEETGDDSDVDPLMQMRYSDDHGRIWSYWLTAAMGKIGEYSTRLQWNNLGASPHRQYEFRTGAKVEVTLSNAYLDVTPGSY